MAKQKGQDTVTYIFKDSKLFSVLLIPHIVTQEQVDLLMTQRGVLDYDVYDHQNDRTLKAALYASLPLENQAQAPAKDGT